MSLFRFLRKKELRNIEVAVPGQKKPDGELNLDSPTWIFIQNWAVKELERARISNDNFIKSEVETAITRGEIKFAKKLLSLGKLTALPIDRHAGHIPVDRHRGLLAVAASTRRDDDNTYAGY